MFNYENFNEVFDPEIDWTYREASLQGIEKNRKSLDGLFLDKVLRLLAVAKPSHKYPPKSQKDLRSLHKAIIDSSGADHHKISVLYYLIVDADAATRGTNYSTMFAEAACLPSKYSLYMKGLWHMDHLEFELALSYLTHPSLIPTFPDEILETLVKKSKDNDYTLPLAYYHTVQPALTTRHAIEQLFDAIAKTSVTEAFSFCQGQPEFAQRLMFERLVALVIHHSPKETIADRSVELVNLPFNREQEEWFEEYLKHGEGKKLERAKDTLMMRKLGTGSFAESLSLRHGNSRLHGGLDWATISNAVKGGLGPRMDV